MTQQIVIHGDCRTLTPSQVAECDVMITDPPYSERVHTKAVSCTGSNGVLSNARKRPLGFDHLSPELRAWLCGATALVKRWSVIYSDIESTHHLRNEATAAGATYIRTVAWIRWSMPQLSGDRPPSGREDLLIFHRGMAEELGEPDGVAQGPVGDVALFYGSTKGRKAWNGPGNLTHLQHKCLRGEGKHRAEKPLDQALDLVSWFSDPGEIVLDPFAGSGTLGLSCAILGRNYVGFELDEKWVHHARARIARGTEGFDNRDTERYRRYLATQPVLPEPDSLI